MADNNIQQPPTGTELANNELQKYWLDLSVDYPEPFYLLEYKEVPFSSMGDIQAISGQKKNGKTFLEVQLMAAILATGAEHVNAYLPGLRVPDKTMQWLKDQKGTDYLPKVLYVDTEQSQLMSAKVMRRVHWLCGWDMKTPNPRFKTLWLRTVEGNDVPLKRWQLIQQAIDEFEPDALFIDGLRDIIHDFNDLDESQEMINQLMRLSSNRMLCNWNVLHFNPRIGGDDDGKMRGHLGTELGNKVTDTLTSTKKRVGDDAQFTVHQPDARSKDIPDWKFEIIGNLGVPRIMSDTIVVSNEVHADDLEQIKDWITKAQSVVPFPLSRSDVKKRVFADFGHQKNATKQQKDLEAALANGLLKESDQKVNGYKLIDIGDDIPF